MKFSPTPLQGAVLIKQKVHEDNRGNFSRVFCRQQFKHQGLKHEVSQVSESFNKAKGTIRGLHFQIAPYEETKLIRCTKGHLFDVIVDIRPGSSSFGQHFATELKAGDGQMLYVPGGFAHGFQTLTDETVISYSMLAGEYHEPSGRGYRWSDPAFSIDWPINDNVIVSERDNNYPLINHNLK